MSSGKSWLLPSGVASWDPDSDPNSYPDPNSNSYPDPKPNPNSYLDPNPKSYLDPNPESYLDPNPESYLDPNPKSCPGNCSLPSLHSSERSHWIVLYIMLIAYKHTIPILIVKELYYVECKVSSQSMYYWIQPIRLIKAKQGYD